MARTTTRATLSDAQMAQVTEAVTAGIAVAAQSLASQPRSAFERAKAVASFGGLAIAIVTFIFYVGVTSGDLSNLKQELVNTKLELGALKANQTQTDLAVAGQDKATAIITTRLERIQLDVATLIGRTERPSGGIR